MDNDDDALQEILVSLETQLAATKEELTATKAKLAEITLYRDLTILDERERRHALENANKALFYELKELKKTHAALEKALVPEDMSPDSKPQPEPEPEPEPQPQPEPEPQPDP